MSKKTKNVNRWLKGFALFGAASLLLTDIANAAPVKIEDNASGWTYQNFPQYSDPQASGRTAHGGTRNGGSAQRSFTGTSVEVYSEKSQDGGSLEIIIDGLSRGTVSLTASRALYNQRVFSIANLSQGNHTLRIVARSSRWNNFDYIIVDSASMPQPTPVPTPNPTPQPTPNPTPQPTPQPTPPPATNAFYVSPSGSDSNAGTLQAPFASIRKAQSAMRASSTIKTTYIRAGEYTLAPISNCADGEICGLSITEADNGTSYRYYPPDGVNSAKINGGSTRSGTGLYYVIATGGDSNVTIDGLTIYNFQYAGIGSVGGSRNLTIRNNVIYNGTYAAVDDNPGGISLYGTTNAIISHNVVYDMASWGISVVNADGDISGMLVEGNFVYNTCKVTHDCSAIYSFDGAASAKNMRWINNYVRDGNLSAPLDTGLGSALYADDCVSNLTMSGNVITGRNGSNTIHIHGGYNNHITGNLTDLGTYQQAIAAFQIADGLGCADGRMTGNSYSNNVIVSANGGGNFWLIEGISATQSPAISNNAYWNYGGAKVSSDGDYRDVSPVYVNPLLSGYNYTLAPNSPVRNAPVSFQGVPGQWGPPGYVIPQTGSAPSVPR